MDESVVADWLEHVTAGGVNLTARRAPVPAVRVGGSRRRRRRRRSARASYTRDPEMDPIDYERVLKTKQDTSLRIYWYHLATFVRAGWHDRVFSTSYLRSQFYVYMNEAIERSMHSLYCERDVHQYMTCIEYMEQVLEAWDEYIIANRGKLPTMGLEGRDEVTNPWMCRIRLYLLVNFGLVIEDGACADDIVCLTAMEATFVDRGPILASRSTPVMRYTLDDTIQSLYELRACWREIPYSPGLLRYFHLLRARYAAFTSELHENPEFMNRIKMVSGVTLEDGRTRLHVNRAFFDFGEEVMQGMEIELASLQRICSRATIVYCSESRARGPFRWMSFPERYSDKGCYRSFEVSNYACPQLPVETVVHFFNWIFQYTDTARGPYIMRFFRGKRIMNELIRPGERWSFAVANQSADPNDINVINRMRPKDMDRYQNLLLKATPEDILRCVKLHLIRYYQLDRWPDQEFEGERQRRKDERLARIERVRREKEGSRRMNDNNAEVEESSGELASEVLLEEDEHAQEEEEELNRLTEGFFASTEGESEQEEEEDEPELQFLGDPLFRNTRGEFEVESSEDPDADYSAAISNAKLRSQINSLAFSAGGALKLLEPSEPEHGETAPKFLDYSSMETKEGAGDDEGSTKARPADFWLKKRRQGFYEEEIDGQQDKEVFDPEEYPGLHNVWNELCLANFKYVCREMLDKAVDWDKVCLPRGTTEAKTEDPVIFQTTSGYAVWSSRRTTVWIEMTFVEAAWRWLTELVHEEYQKGPESVLVDQGPSSAGAEVWDAIAQENRRVMMNGMCELVQMLFGDSGREQLAAYEVKYDTTGRGRNYEKMQLEAQLKGLAEGEKGRRRVQHRFQTNKQVRSGALNASKLPQVYL